MLFQDLYISDQKCLIWGMYCLNILNVHSQLLREENLAAKHYRFRAGLAKLRTAHKIFGFC